LTMYRDTVVAAYLRCLVLARYIAVRCTQL
jgi:hypothetical protein